jgi:Protein of unknown function (DUF4038)/Putative collagen-binding domain of a collagenase
MFDYTFRKTSHQMINKINLFGLAVLILGTSFVCSAQSPVFPLKKSTNSRYLVDQNNKPFPILGRTAWFVISLSVSDYKTFIANAISHGYNSIEFHVVNHDPRGNHPPFNGNGDMPFLKRLDGSDWDGSLVYTDTTAQAPDLTTPNEAYWKYVDTFLSYCESKSLEVFMFPAYVGYANSNQGWMPELVANGAARSQAYGKWIASRYKHQKNIVWMLLGDMGNFTAAQKEAEGALIRGLKGVEGQMSTEYSAESGPGENSADQKDFGDQMTLNGAYTWGEKGTTDVPTLGRIAYSHSPVMPAFLLEEPYDEEGPDGNNVNPNAIQPVRRFQWWGWLSTIGGYISGNGYIWPFSSPDWKKHLDTQGSFDMERLNKFIKSITWWNLVPSGLDGMKTLITAGGNMSTDSDYVAAAASHEGTLLVAYVPPSHSGSITVDMSAMAGSTRARWFDPTSGIFTNISGSPFANKGTFQFTPPGKNHVGEGDWVLLLEASESIGKKSSPVKMPISGPLSASKNPNYFQDANGKTLILCGSHSWNTLQDWGSNGPVQKLDFDAFVRFLKAHGHRNMVNAPINGIGHAPNPRWDNFWDNLGYILKYSRRMNLAKVIPHQVLSSTGYCLAQTPATGAEYLVYASHGRPFTVDLSAMSNKRKLAVEWFNPATGTTTTQSPIPAGSASQSFSAPFSGDAVLYLVDTEGHK